MFRRLSLAFVAAAALSACDEAAETPVSPTQQIDATADARPDRGEFFALTLLHNNDAESALLADGDIGGVARFASVVADLRAEGEECGPRGRAPNYSCDVLVVSSGDNFLAGPQFNASTDAGYDPFYDAIGVNAIGYDAIAIGNHEFDFGPAVLAAFIGAVDDAPFLSANLDVSTEPALAGVADRIAASTVVETEGGVEVGIIGATTERLDEISSPGLVGIGDVRSAVMAEVMALEAEGVNRIILISHLQSVEEDRALITGLRGIDIVVAGGGDELLAGADSELLPGDEPDGPYPIIAQDADGEDVPLVTTSGSFEYVGRLQVIFQGGRVQRVLDGSGPIAVIGGAQDGALLASVEAPVANEVEDLQNEVVGSTNILLDGTRGLVRTRETAYGSLIADAILAAAPGGADIAIANGGGIRNSVVIEPGSDITRFDTFQTLPFSNFVYTLPGVTPTRLLEVLENAVSRVEFVDGRFAQVAGLEFSYDASQPEGSRIIDVTVGGTPYVVDGVAQAEAPLRLAIVNFLAGGGDGYPLGDLTPETGPTTYQKALEDYIGALVTVEAGDVPLGRITCVGGACPS